MLSEQNKPVKFKTAVDYGTKDPHWNAEFTIEDLSADDIRGKTLQISLWDYEKGSRHHLLGGTRLGLGKSNVLFDDSFGIEVTAWQKMLDNPGIWNETMIPLRSTLESVKEYVLLSLSSFSI